MALLLRNDDGTLAFAVDDFAVIGRDPSCDLVVDVGRVSRRHCRVERADGGFLVRDLGSRNGTLLNDQRVGEATLRAGDRLGVGDATWRLELADAPPSARHPEPSVIFAKIPVGGEALGVGSARWAETLGPHTRGTTVAEALYAGSVVASRAETDGEIASRLLESALALVEGDAGTVWRVQGSTSIPIAQTGDATGLRALADELLRDGANLIRVSEGGARSYLGVFLGAPGSVIGLLTVATRRRHVEADDLQLLVALANQAALGILARRRLTRLEVERDSLRRGGPGSVELVGDSEAMRELRDLVGRAARSWSPVLIQGESGTGKELVARSLHRASPASDGPFVAVNCGALVDTLIQSELFGHERGAFTGADRRKVGFFERANGGTLFLDEVAELSLDAQVRLLRVLESWSVQRIGGDRDIPVQVRLVAASHRDLAKGVDEGTFREDLYYRIEVVRVRVPALRDRLEDLPALCAHLLTRVDHPRSVEGLSPAALRKLEKHGFPGNVRELRNVLERAIILGSGETIEADQIIDLDRRETPGTSSPLRTLREVEEQHIARVLEHVGWNKSDAARILGIERPTIYSKIKRHGLEPREG